MPSLAAYQALQLAQQMMRNRRQPQGASQQWLARHRPQPRSLNVFMPSGAGAPSKPKLTPPELTFDEELNRKRQEAEIPFELKEKYGALAREREAGEAETQQDKLAAAYAALGYGPMARPAAEAGIELPALQGEKRMDLSEMESLREQAEEERKRAEADYRRRHAEWQAKVERGNKEYSEFLEQGERRRALEEYGGALGHPAPLARAAARANVTLRAPELPGPEKRSGPVLPDAHALLQQLDSFKRNANMEQYNALMADLVAEVREGGSGADIARDVLRRIGVRSE